MALLRSIFRVFKEQAETFAWMEGVYQRAIIDAYMQEAKRQQLWGIQQTPLNCPGVTVYQNGEITCWDVEAWELKGGEPN